MKRIALLGLLMVVVASLGACAPGATPTPAAPPLSPTIARIKEAGKLRAGVVVCVPWTGKDLETGELFGPAIDVARWIAEELDVELELIESDWGVIVPGLAANKFDIAAAALDPTPEREEVADFVRWAPGGSCYLVRKDNDKVNTVGDLNNPDVVIATITGAADEKLAMGKYPNAQFDSAPAPAGAMTRLAEVLSGRADVTVIDSAVALFFEETYPELKIIPGGAEYCIEHPDMFRTAGVTVQKGDPVWKGLVQAVISEHQDEIVQAIIQYSAPEYIKSWFE